MSSCKFFLEKALGKKVFSRVSRLLDLDVISFKVKPVLTDFYLMLASSCRRVVLF